MLKSLLRVCKVQLWLPTAPLMFFHYSCIVTFKRGIFLNRSSFHGGVHVSSTFMKTFNLFVFGHFVRPSFVLSPAESSRDRCTERRRCFVENGDNPDPPPPPHLRATFLNQRLNLDFLTCSQQKCYKRHDAKHVNHMQFKKQ